MNWQKVLVAEAFEFVRNGKNVKQTKERDGLPITRIETIAERYIDPDRVGYAGLSENGNEQWLLQPGDILFSHINSVDHIGKCAIYEGVPEKLVHGMNLLALRPSKRLLPKFAFYALSHSSFRAKLQPFVNKAVNQASVSTTNLKSLDIPLPPLNEQKRIAAILDKADALRAKRRQAIVLLDSLTQSIFLEMFGDPVSNPKGWPMARLENCVTLDAPLVDPRLPEFSSLLHYGPDRIEKDIGRLLPAKTAAQDNLISKKFLCDDRHVLYSKIRPYLNKVALSPGQCLCSADMYPVEPKVGIVDKFYLWFILRTASFLSYAEGCSGRANIPKINREQLMNFRFPLPSIEVQQQFSRVVRQLENSRLTHQSAHNQSEFLVASLQNRAFTGQL